MAGFPPDQISAAKMTVSARTTTCDEILAIIFDIVSLPCCSCRDGDPETQVGQARALDLDLHETTETTGYRADIVAQRGRSSVIISRLRPHVM
jgi:hypothetical protein